jgi:hypothetical protein
MTLFFFPLLAHSGIREILGEIVESGDFLEKACG